MKHIFSFLLVSADQGRLLDYIVSWGNLTEEKVSLYLRDVLEALHYLHACRIAHLDLKVGFPIELFFINVSIIWGSKLQDGLK